MGLLPRFLESILDERRFAGWPETRTDTKLEIDLAGGRLGTVSIGDPEDRVRELMGRPRSFGAMKREGKWIYPAHGLVFETADGRVDSLMAHVAGTPYGFGSFAAEVRPFAGAIRMGGAATPAVAVTRARIEAELGNSEGIEEDDEEIILTYERGRAEMELELTPDGCLTTVLIYAADGTT